MREEVVDSSVFLSSLVKNEESHNRATALVEDMDNEEAVFHIPATVLLEVISVISRIASIEEAREAKNIMDFWIEKGKIKVYALDQRRLEEAIEIAVTHKLRGTDAIVTQLSEELNMPLVALAPKL